MKSLNVLISYTLIVLAMVLVMPDSAMAQDDQEGPIVVQVDFFKSKAGGNYMSLEMDIYKAIHHEMIKQGQKLGWYLYQVRFPYGSQAEYDFVTVNVYRDMKQAMGDPLFSFEDLAQDVHSNIAAEELTRMTEAARDFIKMELFSLIDEAVVGTGEKPAEFVRVNFMDVNEGVGPDYVQHELEWFKPYHMAMIEAGARYDWSLYARSVPYGDAYGYNFLTIDFYKNLDQLVAPEPTGLMQEVHKDKDVQYLIRDKTSKLRTLTRQETWQLVDYTRGIQDE